MTLEMVGMKWKADTGVRPLLPFTLSPLHETMADACPLGLACSTIPLQKFASPAVGELTCSPSHLLLRL